MNRAALGQWWVLGLVIAATAITAGCLRAQADSQVPVRLHVFNRTAEPITVRWKDNRISGESEPIGPGEVTGVDALYTVRGAGNFRVFVLGQDGRTLRVKRFDGQELRAAKFIRKLTVTSPRVTEAHD